MSEAYHMCLIGSRGQGKECINLPIYNPKTADPEGGFYELVGVEAINHLKGYDRRGNVFGCGGWKEGSFLAVLINNMVRAAEYSPLMCSRGMGDLLTLHAILE